MTGYVIWGSILLFFVILMVSPIVLSVKLGEENVIFVRYLFVKIPLFPAKEKSEAQKQKEKEKKEAKKHLSSASLLYLTKTTQSRPSYLSH